LRNAYKSGVTGYRFAEATASSRIGRRMKKCNFYESAWRSSVFDFTIAKTPQPVANR